MHQDITHEFTSLRELEEMRAARQFADKHHKYLKTDAAKLEIYREYLAWRRLYEIDRKYRYTIGEIQKCNR